MDSDNNSGAVVAEGTWLYDGAVRETIEIVAFNYDFWFELPGDDGRSEWKPYPLNDEGVLYYVRTSGEPLPMKPFSSIGEAKAWTEAQPWGPVAWSPTSQN
jgi:hypothetical protein